MSVVGTDGGVAGSTAATDARPPSLWRHRTFLYYWSGQSISMLGSTISFIALPLVGVLTLGLDAFHMGLVATGSKLPSMLLNPFIGPVVDRINRRRLMIAADAVRALLIGSVPLAAVLHVLTIWQLIVVGGGVNLLTSLFNVAYQSFLPNVVATTSLGDANSMLEASSSAAGVGGPGIAGWLVGVVGAAFTVAVDAVSYAVSAVLLVKMRVGDTGPSTARALRGLRGFWTDTTSGFTLLWRDRVLRSLSISFAVLTLFAQVQMAIYLLFLVQVIHLSAALIGLIFTLSGIVGFFGALVAGPVSRRLGSGRLVVLGQAAIVTGGILLAAVTGSRLQASVTMLIGEAFFGIGMAFWGVGSATLNQTRTANDVRGRIIGASSVLTGVMATVAGLVGGGIADVFGLRVALVSGSIGMFFALVLVLRRDVWRSDTREWLEGT